MTQPDEPVVTGEQPSEHQPASACLTYGLFQRKQRSENTLFSAPPCLACIADASSLREPASFRWRNGRPAQCVFWRKAIWSPQGSHLLTQSEDHHVEIFSVANREIDPAETVSRDGHQQLSAKGKEKAKHQEHSGPMILRRTLDWPAPSPVVSVAWHPFALASVSTAAQDDAEDVPVATKGTDWAFVVSCRDTPIKVIDADTGQVRGAAMLLASSRTTCSNKPDTE